MWTNLIKHRPEATLTLDAKLRSVFSHSGGDALEEFKASDALFDGERPANAFCPERYWGESYVINDSLVT